MPKAAAGTKTTAVKSQSAAGPPGPDWWIRLSSGTVDSPAPSVSTPSATATAGATRCELKTVLTGVPAPLPPGGTGMSQP